MKQYGPRFFACYIVEQFKGDRAYCAKAILGILDSLMRGVTRTFVQLFLENTNLLLQVFDDGLLPAVHPPAKANQQKRQRIHRKTIPLPAGDDQLRFGTEHFRISCITHSINRFGSFESPDTTGSHRVYAEAVDAADPVLRIPGAPLDNNEAERILTRCILHRKNSLYYRTSRGASVGALFMSVVETCRANGVNPFDYMMAIVRNAPSAKANPSAWIPWNFKSPHAQYTTLQVSTSAQPRKSSPNQKISRRGTVTHAYRKDTDLLTDH